MFQQTLVPRNEYVFGEGAALALWSGLLIRVLWNFLTLKKVTIMDAQLFWVLLLIALIYAWGSLVPRRWSLVGIGPLGALGWLAAITILAAVTWLPVLRDLWWDVPLLGQAYPLWLKIVAAAALVAGILLRLRAQRRAGIVVLSRGHERTLTWAEEQPFYCRVVVKRILSSRGLDC